MKKKLLTLVAVILAAAALVAASVAGTVAYLTASSAVSNVFTVGNVSMTMFEHKVDPIDGTADPNVEVDTNTYHLVDGKTYAKDPTIRVTSTDSMYLFVKSSNQIRTIEAGNVTASTNKDGNPTMRKQMENNGWVEFVQSGDGVEIVWVYGTRDPATGVITPVAVNKESQNSIPGKTGNTVKGEFSLCEEFTVADKGIDITLYAAAKVTFTGFGIQSTLTVNDGNVAKTAWDALKSTYPYEGGIVNPVNPYDSTKTGDDAYVPVPDPTAP
ncbi:MAG: SipW-dependent-type signal peptide-containing protein [Clostridia bacterium]|nr:SipW-dependent-type signal peptide-containing protein [Clostridia bacterium]